ncbi:putative pol-like protein, partial [Operophtera brumata]
MAAASIQTIWHHALLVIGIKEYSTVDKGPFIIHVAREEPDPSAGTTIRPIKFGQFLSNHHVTNICSDGIKQVGRNRISVEFRTAVDANKFLDNTTLLFQYKYIASIPVFNITRMGLVQNVPVDMSMEEFATSLEVPSGCGFVVKARRLNRKSHDEGKVPIGPLLVPFWINQQKILFLFIQKMFSLLIQYSLTQLLQKRGWINYCENLSPRTPPSLVWKQIKRYRGACNSMDITSNDPLSWVEAFSDKLAPSSVPNYDSIPVSPLFLPSVCTFDSNFSFHELQLALDGLKDTSPGVDDHGLSLSASKSSCIVFSKKRTPPVIDLYVNQVLIPQVNGTKFLGIHLDSRMNGIPHTNYISQICEKNVNVLRSLSGVWWGSHPYCQKLLYNAIVRSHLDYGSFLLDPCTKLALGKLDRVQSKCLRIIISAMKSSPLDAMQVECVDPPLSLRRHLLETHINDHQDKIPCLVRSFMKYSRLPHPVVQSQIISLFSTPYEALIYQPNIVLDFGIAKGSLNARQIFYEQLHSKYHGWLPIFTDASKLSNTSPVGSAVWIPSSKIILSFKCSSATSVFTGESIALLESINFVKSHNLNNSIVFTDSKSSLQSILSNPFRSKSRFPITLKIRESLLKCHELGINIVLAWIPGHAGIPGNESVDSCAKQAAQI